MWQSNRINPLATEVLPSVAEVAKTLDVSPRNEQLTADLARKRVRLARIRSRAAFSLVELMVVMIILGLLAATTTVATRTYLNNARITKVTVDMSTFVKGIDSFYAANGRYPNNDEGLEILAAPTKNSPDGYLNKISKDPWKNPYVYVYSGAKSGSKIPYEIICLGADGKEGGQGTDKDISSAKLDDL